MAEITLVKGETSALDRTWMSMPDGSTRQVAVHVVHDLPHLVVESLFGIEDGLWGVLARGGFSAANLARTRSRSRRPRLVTDVSLDEVLHLTHQGRASCHGTGRRATPGSARHGGHGRAGRRS